MNWDNVQRRVLETAKGQFLFRVTDAGRDFLLREGTDQRYGARHLKRAIERHVVYPLANLLATEQVQLGDLVRIDWDGEHNLLTFVREGEGALVSTDTAESGKLPRQPPKFETARPPTRRRKWWRNRESRVRRCRRRLPRRRHRAARSPNANQPHKFRQAARRLTAVVCRFLSVRRLTKTVSSALILLSDETVSQRVRQFPQLQLVVSD